MAIVLKPNWWKSALTILCINLAFYFVPSKHATNNNSINLIVITIVNFFCLTGFLRSKSITEIIIENDFFSISYLNTNLTIKTISVPISIVSLKKEKLQSYKKLTEKYVIEIKGKNSFVLNNLFTYWDKDDLRLIVAFFDKN